MTSSHLSSPWSCGEKGGGKEAAKWKNESLQATRQKAETDLNMETETNRYSQRETHVMDPCSHLDQIHTQLIIIINDLI